VLLSKCAHLVLRHGEAAPGAAAPTSKELKDLLQPPAAAAVTGEVGLAHRCAAQELLLLLLLTPAEFPDPQLLPKCSLVCYLCAVRLKYNESVCDSTTLTPGKRQQQTESTRRPAAFVCSSQRARSCYQKTEHDFPRH
jgi:hypothetical protein